MNFSEMMPLSNHKIEKSSLKHKIPEVSLPEFSLPAVSGSYHYLYIVFYIDTFDNISLEIIKKFFLGVLPEFLRIVL